MGWYDSPEIVAAAASLGVPHSPGHPLPVLLGKLGTLLPVGDMAFRVNLMSAVADAGAAVAMLAAGRSILDRAAPSLPRAARETAATAVAMLYALSWPAWFQGTRAEVYALQALLCALALALVLRGLHGPHGSEAALHRTAAAAHHDPRDGRCLLAAGLLTGLALATHHFIALTFLVPAAAVVLVCWRPGARRACATAMLGVLGLAALLQLPVRAAAHPVVNWGVPDTAGRFGWTVSARAFHKAASDQHVSPPAEDLVQVLATLGGEATLPLALAALLGLYLGLRFRRTRTATVLLTGIAAFGVLGRVLVGFDPETPDHHGYLLPALGATMLLGLAGLGVLAEQLTGPASPNAADTADAADAADAAGGADATRPQSKRMAGALMAALLLLLLPWQLIRTWPRADLSRASASDELARWELEDLPPRTLLISAYFQTSFRLWALRAVEQARPDVAILDRSFLTYPGMAGEARRAHPELAPLIDAPLRAGAPLPLARLAELARTRPVRVQLHPNLDVAADAWLLPDGPFAALGPEPPPAEARALAERRDDEARRDLSERMSMDTVPRADRAAVRDALLWHDFVRLELFCRQARPRPAQMALHHAWALAPGDAMLREIAQRCGVPLPELP